MRRVTRSSSRGGAGVVVTEGAGAAESSPATLGSPWSWKAPSIERSNGIEREFLAARLRAAQGRHTPCLWVSAAKWTSDEGSGGARWAGAVQRPVYPRNR